MSDQHANDNEQHVIVVSHEGSSTPTVYGFFSSREQAVDWAYVEIPLRGAFIDCHIVPVTNKD